MLSGIHKKQSRAVVLKNDSGGPGARYTQAQAFSGDGACSERTVPPAFCSDGGASANQKSSPKKQLTDLFMDGPLAATLPRSISDSDPRLTNISPPTGNAGVSWNLFRSGLNRARSISARSQINSGRKVVARNYRKVAAAQASPLGGLPSRPIQSD